MKWNCFIAILFLSFVACGSNDDGELPQIDVKLTCSPEQLEATAVAADYQLNVTCSSGEWTAFASDDCSEWITARVSDASLTQGRVTVSLSANTSNAVRQGSVVIKSGTTRVTVPVIQEAPMEISASDLYAYSAGGSYTLTVTASKDWNVRANDSWLTATKSDAQTVSIEVASNADMTSRIGTLDIMSGLEKVTVSVCQESAEDCTVTIPEGYSLVWHDEFNEGSELDKAHWTHEVQASGWVNNELQNYVNGAYNGRRVTELSDGKLRIHCFKEGGKVYSGRVYAHVDKGWQYGYMEARLMLPKGKGTWPAFWMMPVTVDWATEGWPKCGEIDIMEEVGVVPNEVSSSLHAEGHNHTNNTQVTKAKKIEKAEGEFHTYAIEWTEQNITTYVDGEVLLSYDNDGQGVRNWPYDKPYYIILNLAWGGSWGGMNGVDETALPVSYVIDYVRVFQKK